ncbi:MAG: ATP-binding protein [Candidatus Aenigmarchaeota archaeon]|nr:ATP-binding protein [Candidatus Aenigmarchaeota archaeon]
MEEQEILREMEAQNRWWVEKNIELDKSLIERGVYKQVLDEVNKKEVTGLIGLRRVGKTTILKQIISYLLRNGVDPKKILFFSFDGFKKEEKILKQVIEIYSRYILEAELAKTEKIYVFFDEIQKVGEWGEEMKSIYDKNYKIKFFVTGSSSMNILRGSGESLVGRINIHKVFPFKFREFLNFRGVQVDQKNIYEIKYPTDSENIITSFNKYLKLGGFPELYLLTDQDIKTKIKTFLDLTFYRDIVNLFEIKRPDVLDGLFLSLLRESGNLVNYNNLSNSLNTKFETIKTYIEYLSYSFLISQSKFFSNSRKTVEKNTKIYVSDHSFSNISEIEEGLKIETVIYNHCKCLVDQGEFDGIFYWRNRKNEVDIVLTSRKEVLPIEVKYREDPKKIPGLLKFMNEFTVKKSIVVTKDLFEKKQIDGKEVNFIPAWLFLLAV